MSPPWLISVALCAGIAAAQSAQPQRTFDTAQSAADALIAATERDDVTALVSIFGPDGKDLVQSGDAVQDRNARVAFLSAANDKKSVVVDPKNSNLATLSVGNEEWPFPIPLVKSKGKWRFDAAAGREELLQRRIGTNELDAIEVCRGFVEAQAAYASEIHDDSGIHQYAQKIFSSPGKQDGLYWATADGSAGGPISKPVANAIREGYPAEPGGGYHGYNFIVLHGQGPAAPMGQLDYVIKGVMIGGFALIAVPVEYGVSGIQTFMVGPNGSVYQKDLGPRTETVARTLTRFNPDETWKLTEDEWPADAVR